MLRRQICEVCEVQNCVPSKLLTVASNEIDNPLSAVICATSVLSSLKV